jgi:ferrous iron transport protein B
LTIQLAEMGVPLVLALNMLDEAQFHGVAVNCPLLSEALGLPVIPTVAPHGEGLAALTNALATTSAPTLQIHYPDEIEQAINQIAAMLPPARIAGRALALLWLSGDVVVEAWLAGGADLRRIYQSMGDCHCAADHSSIPAR